MLLQTKDKHLTNAKGPPRKTLIDAILEVKPDIVQLEVPYRPTSQRNVEPPSQKTLRKLSRDLSESLGEERLWVYGIHDRRGERVAWITHRRSTEKEVIELLQRRPCRAIDVSNSLGIDLPTTNEILQNLEEKAQITSKMMKKEKYFKRTNF
jgi:wyosine [tRNA(Phe)-imidazoG37] synthetase (radical SAM superfamily)